MDDPLYREIDQALKNMKPAQCWQEFQALSIEIRTDLLDVAYWALGIDVPEADDDGRKVRPTDGPLAVLQFSVGNPSLIGADEEGPFVFLPTNQIQRVDRLMATLGPSRMIVLLTFSLGVVAATARSGSE